MAFAAQEICRGSKGYLWPKDVGNDKPGGGRTFARAQLNVYAPDQARSIPSLFKTNTPGPDVDPSPSRLIYVDEILLLVV